MVDDIVYINEKILNEFIKEDKFIVGSILPKIFVKYVNIKLIIEIIYDDGYFVRPNKNEGILIPKIFLLTENEYLILLKKKERLNKLKNINENW